MLKEICFGMCEVEFSAESYPGQTDCSDRLSRKSRDFFGGHVKTKKGTKSSLVDRKIRMPVHQPVVESGMHLQKTNFEFRPHVILVEMLQLVDEFADKFGVFMCYPIGL